VNWLIAFLSCLLLVAGCTYPRGRLALASLDVPGQYVILKPNVRGRDCFPTFLGIPPRGLEFSLGKAVESAVGQVPDGDMMINVSIREEIWAFVLYNRYCIRVDGDVVNSKSPSGSSGGLAQGTPPDHP